jgi:hypothetical protein
VSIQTRRIICRRAGLGMIEAMISLVISAALLTACASSFVAASDAISENDSFFQATQAGRVTLNRILTQCRRGTVSTASTSSSLRVITDTGADLSYTYNSNAHTMTQLNNGTSASCSLAHNLSSAQFDLTTGTDYAGQTAVTRIAVTLTVKVGNNQVLLSGSATPRRNFSL